MALDDSKFLITCTFHRKASFFPLIQSDLLYFDGPKQQPEEHTIFCKPYAVCSQWKNLHHHHHTNNWPAGSSNDTAHVVLPFYPSIPWWGPARAMEKPCPSNFAPESSPAHHCLLVVLDTAGRICWKFSDTVGMGIFAADAMWLREMLIILQEIPS